MGTICYSKQEKQILQDEGLSHSKDASQHVQAFQQIKFLYSHHPVQKLSADCLIIFADKSLTLKRNQHFIRLYGGEGKKIQAFILAFVDRYQIDLNQETALLVSIVIPSIKFLKVCVIICEPWNNEIKLTNLQNAFKSGLHQIQNQKDITSIVITQFNSEFGIPLLSGVKILLKELKEVKSEIKEIHFACLNQDSVIIYKEAVTNFDPNENLRESIAKSVSDSFYY